MVIQSYTISPYFKALKEGGVDAAVNIIPEVDHFNLIEDFMYPTFQGTKVCKLESTVLLERICWPLSGKLKPITRYVVTFWPK